MGSETAKVDSTSKPKMAAEPNLNSKPNLKLDSEPVKSTSDQETNESSNQRPGQKDLKLRPNRKQNLDAYWDPNEHRVLKQIATRKLDWESYRNLVSEMESQPELWLEPTESESEEEPEPKPKKQHTGWDVWRQLNAELELYIYLGDDSYPQWSPQW